MGAPIASPERLINRAMLGRMDNWLKFRWEETKQLCGAHDYPRQGPMSDPDRGGTVELLYPIPRNRYEARILLRRNRLQAALIRHLTARDRRESWERS